jgi:hypothetical protein
MTCKPITILTVLIALGASSLVAAAPRTFVSTSGLDTNPCSRPLPCRGFAAAVTQTQSGGEIYVLDSGGYGSVSVAQAITIRADGVSAGISVLPGFDGVDVNVASGDVVTLHGLTINGLGGNDGVLFVAGGTLHLEDVTVANMSIDGVEMTAAGELDVLDSTLRDNFANDGLRVHPTGGAAAIVSVDGSRFEGNNAGVIIEDGVNAIVRNSLAASNRSLGFVAEAGSTGRSDLMLESCVSSGNGHGVSAQQIGQQGQGVPFITISNVTVYGNSVGLETVNAGAIVSFGNNSVDGNLTNGSPTFTFSRF